jgi:hypothetical protein
MFQQHGLTPNHPTRKPDRPSGLSSKTLREWEDFSQHLLSEF